MEAEEFEANLSLDRQPTEDEVAKREASWAEENFASRSSGSDGGGGARLNCVVS